MIFLKFDWVRNRRHAIIKISKIPHFLQMSSGYAKNKNNFKHHSYHDLAVK